MTGKKCPVIKSLHHTTNHLCDEMAGTKYPAIKCMHHRTIYLCDGMARTKRPVINYVYHTTIFLCEEMAGTKCPVIKLWAPYDKISLFWNGWDEMSSDKSWGTLSVILRIEKHGEQETFFLQTMKRFLLRDLFSQFSIEIYFTESMVRFSCFEEFLRFWGHPHPISRTIGTSTETQTDL